MKVGDYPGIYHMVEIPPEDWHLLPEVPPGMDSVNLDSEAEERLERAGYIVGWLQRVIFHDPGIKDTNWSATAPVTGPDRVQRRWVYLHYFKDGQPSINWLDPTFAGMRLVIGDALHSLSELGAGALRLDANGFLGVEPSTEEGAPAWSEGYPLSEAVNQLIASMVRKVGGFTFQELNLAIDDIKRTSERGADLSDDFVNRPAYAHAMATGDTEFLRLTLNAAMQHGLQPVRLIHALQNHDEMTYELRHFATAHQNDSFSFRGAELTGGELAVKIRGELIERLTGPAGPYNATFTTNGIASTTATIIAAAMRSPPTAGDTTAPTVGVVPTAGRHRLQYPRQRLCRRRSATTRSSWAKCWVVVTLTPTAWTSCSSRLTPARRPTSSGYSSSRTAGGAGHHGRIAGRIPGRRGFAAHRRVTGNQRHAGRVFGDQHRRRGLRRGVAHTTTR